MAPPLPPPGVPPRAGLAPCPMAWLPVITQLSTAHETPMLDSAPPLEHTPSVKVLPNTYTGRLCDWLSARTAAPPRSGPVASQRLCTNLELTIRSRPPRSKMAPPPPPSVMSPVELPPAKVMFWTTSSGVSWSWQCEVVQPWALSHVFWYRIRRA